MASSDHRTARVRGWFLWLVLVCVSSAQAHQHWIDTDNFYPSPGDTDRVYVRSGHYFPKAALKPAQNVLRGVVVRAPDGQTIPLTVEAGEKQWLGSLLPQAQGVYLVTFSLGPARAPQPKYEAKAILVVGTGGDSADSYALGTGLELIPGRAISELKPGDELPVSLALDGVPVAGELEVIPADGRSVVTKVSADQPALLSLRKAGRYLVTASIKGRGCSLVFYVREPGTKGE